MIATDWIVSHDATQGDLAYAMECTRCGVVQQIALPISVDCYVAMGKEFTKYHKHCRPQIKEALG